MRQVEEALAGMHALSHTRWACPNVACACSKAHTILKLHACVLVSHIHTRCVNVPHSLPPLRLHPARTRPIKPWYAHTKSAEKVSERTRARSHTCASTRLLASSCAASSPPGCRQSSGNCASCAAACSGCSQG